MKKLIILVFCALMAAAPAMAADAAGAEAFAKNWRTILCATL